MLARAFVLGLILFPAAALAADDLSLDRARTLYKDGNYKDALTTLSRLQELTGPAADAVDRFDLFMLKAETQLQLNDTTGALSTLTVAEKQGSAEQKSQAMALDLLVRRSPGMTFKPKTGDTDRALNILKEATRKEAYAALFADELEPVSKRFATARKAPDIAALLEFSRLLPPLRALETAATGKAAKCEEMARALRERLFVLVDADMPVDEGKVAAITANANKAMTVQVDARDARGRIVRQNVQRRTGPTEAEIAKLKILNTEHEKLRASLKELETLLAITPESLKTRHARNDAFLAGITKVLTTDYTLPIQANPATPKRAGG